MVTLSVCFCYAFTKSTNLGFFFGDIRKIYGFSDVYVPVEEDVHEVIFDESMLAP